MENSRDEIGAEGGIVAPTLVCVYQRGQVLQLCVL